MLHYVKGASEAKYQKSILDRSYKRSSFAKDDILAIHECRLNYECYKFNTSCDTDRRRCKCPTGFISKHEWKKDQQLQKKKASNFCFKLALLEDVCQFDEQCIVKHSVCKLTNSHIKKCGCRTNFTPKGNNVLQNRFLCLCFF